MHTILPCDVDVWQADICVILFLGGLNLIWLWTLLGTQLVDHTILLLFFWDAELSEFHNYLTPVSL